MYMECGAAQLFVRACVVKVYMCKEPSTAIWLHFDLKGCLHILSMKLHNFQVYI